MKGRNSEQRLESVIFETYQQRVTAVIVADFSLRLIRQTTDSSVSRRTLRYLRPRLSGLQGLF